MKRPLVLFLLLGLFLGLLHAAPAGAVGRNANPDVVEDALALATADRTKAARLLEDALAHQEGYKPKEELLVMVNAGEQRRLNGDFDKARDWFTRALAQGSHGWEAEAARLGLALVDAVDGLTPQVIQTLQGVKDKDALPTENADRYLILTVHAARQNDAPDARAWSALALQYAQDDPMVLERVKAHLGALVDESSHALVYKPPDKQPEAEDVLTPLTDLEQAEKALAAGNRDRVAKLAQKIQDDPDASDDDKLAAHYLLPRFDAVPVQPHEIRILLPLSDKYAAAGHQVQQALDFGFTEAGGDANLVYEDSGSTPETAVKALEKLVLQDGVVAVAGPLLTEEAEQVARAAQALRVPLIGLSQGLVPPEGQDWVYEAMVTPQDQVRSLIGYAMGHEQMKAFAIFAPDSNYGHTAAEAFQDEVTQRDGTVTITMFYDPKATDLLPFARTLGRQDYEARRSELFQLRKEAAEKGGDPDKVVLPPTIDFDGLFIPDNVSRIPLATAALAYEEFPVGDFRTTKDGPTIPLLGLSGWDDPMLATQGGPYVRDSIFTDTFFEDTEAAKTFVAAYEERVGRTPSPLQAVTVDAGRLLAATAAQQPDTREAFRDALAEVSAPGAVTGATGFDAETREALRKMRLLTIQGENIVPLDNPDYQPSTQTTDRH